MHLPRYCLLILAFVSVLALAEETPKPEAPALGSAPTLLLKKGQRVAVVGDSITEQRQYSKFIELYLLACNPELDLHTIQLGWSGERAPGFQARMNNDLLPWKPDVVTTCYGMNDGGYGAYNDNIGKAYSAAMTEIVGNLKKNGATVIVGSPGAVDTKFYGKGGPDAAKMYNETLGKLRDLAKDVAQAAGMPFANVHDPMIAAMEKAKAALGAEYDVCGKDGVHPSPNGHVLMAGAFLKVMGFSGEIGTIAVDLKGKTTASEGHSVISAENGKVELESKRYPFCFSGDEKASGGTRSILAFTDFNQTLNRFMLSVVGLDSDKAKITWGKQSLEFSKADLEKGINLNEYFFDNPFCESFKKLDAMVAAKESYETEMIKRYITNFPGMARTLDNDKSVQDVIEELRRKLNEKHAKIEEALRAAIVPVKHTILIEPLK
jgi:lysophospholipase L1-like esterase